MVDRSDPFNKEILTQAFVYLFGALARLPHSFHVCCGPPTSIAAGMLDRECGNLTSAPNR